MLLGTMAAASIVGMLHTRAPTWALAWLPWVTAMWALMLPVAVFLQVLSLSLLQFSNTTLVRIACALLLLAKNIKG